MLDSPAANTHVQDFSNPLFIERLRSQDEAAFGVLVREASGRMMALAKRMLRGESDAHDALQEAFIQAYKALPKFEGRCSLQTWLHTITVRCCLMRLRHVRTRREESIESLLPQFVKDGHRKEPGPRWREVGGEEAAIGAEEREMVRGCIEKLPEDYRDVLLLRDIQEMDTHEVAEMLGVSNGVIKTRLHRARQALRTLLDPYFRRA